MQRLNNSQELFLNKQELFLLSNAYRSCPQHPENWIVSVSTDLQSSESLLCAECISENPNQNTLHILGLIGENEKKVFKNWPVYGQNELHRRLKQIFEANEQIEQIEIEISSFFSSLKKQIELRINQKEEQMMIQAHKLKQLNEQVISHYNKLAEKEQLRSIITNQKNDLKKQNELFKEIFTRVQKNQKKYQEELQEKIDQLDYQKSIINFEAASQINQNIYQLIESIDIFSIKNFDIKISDKSLNKEKFNIPTSQLIFKLISNKLNFCSKELLEKLRDIIFKFSNSIDKIDIKKYLNEDLMKFDFDKLKDSQLDFIAKISENLAQNYLKDEASQEKKSILIKLISNKFNFCSESFLESLSQQFDQIYPLLNKVDFSNYLINGRTSVDGNLLNSHQLIEVAEIVKAIESQNGAKNQSDANQSLQSQQLEQNLKKLSQIYRNKTNYCSDKFIKKAEHSIKNYQSIMQALFLNTEVFEQNREGTMDLSNFTQKQIEDFENLVNKIQSFISLNKSFQINSIIDNFQFNLEQSVEFIKTTYESSSSLSLQKTKQNHYLVSQYKSITGQIVTSQSLDPNLNYIFRCKVNKNLSCNNISFGIMKTQNVHKENLAKDSRCCYLSSNKEYGLDKVIKGKYLCEVREDLDYIEVRVSLSKRKVIFTNYPQYQHINQVNEDKIDNNQEYSFGILFWTPGKDYNIKIMSSIVDDNNFEQYKPYQNFFDN
ncbi:hypothetical protein ABPG74_006678 [Tetrahymena malaccensis]